MKPENARMIDTPPSFIERLTRGLHAYAAAKRAAVSPGTGYSELPIVAGNVDTLAAWIAGCDVEDVRLYALMKTHAVLRDPDEPAVWRPGLEQTRMLSHVGRNGKFDADYSLSELVAAGTEDVITVLYGGMVRAEVERDRLRAEVEELAEIKAHVDLAKSRLEIGATVREIDAANVARQARQMALAAALEEQPEPAAESSDPTAEMPTGVRKHGSGFQAYRRVAGKQAQKTFATVGEAVEWREGLDRKAAA